MRLKLGRQDAEFGHPRPIIGPGVQGSSDSKAKKQGGWEDSQELLWPPAGGHLGPLLNSEVSYWQGSPAKAWELFISTFKSQKLSPSYVH